MIGPLRGSPNRHSWGVFPSANGSWTFHRWQYHSMESAQHFSSNSNCNNTADVLSFTLRTALTTKPFVSDRWGVEIRWFHDESSLKICQSPVTCQQMNFHFSDGSRKFVELCSVSWKFLSCTGTTESIEWLNLASRLSIDDCFEIHVPQKDPKNTTCQIDEFFFGLAEIGWHSTIAPKGIIGPLNGSPNRLSFGIFPSARRSWKLCR